MRDMAAAEHAMHALLSKNGSRTVYPHISHNTMFTKTDEIVNHIKEVAIAVVGNTDSVDLH